MAKRNKQLIKLRHYRDKLLLKIVDLESNARMDKQLFLEIRTALAGKGSTLRAYALATRAYDGVVHEDDFSMVFVDKNDAIAELTLVYKMLSIEREYTTLIQVAVGQRDYLRAAALSATHIAEAAAHDKMLSTWSRDHGFTKSLREECDA